MVVEGSKMKSSESIVLLVVHTAESWQSGEEVAEGSNVSPERERERECVCVCVCVCVRERERERESVCVCVCVCVCV